MKKLKNLIKKAVTSKAGKVAFTSMAKNLESQENGQGNWDLKKLLPDALQDILKDAGAVCLFLETYNLITMP